MDKRKIRRRAKHIFRPQAREDAIRRMYARNYSEGSKCFLLTQHWQKLRPALTFDWHRIRRLCEAMQVTPEELAVMVRLTPREARKWADGMKVHPSVEIHFLMFERAAFGLLSPMATEQIFPVGMMTGENKETDTHG